MGRRVSTTPAALEERRDRIAALTRQGWSAAAIARELGVTVRTVVRAREHRDCRVYVPRRFTADEIAQVEAMLDDGCSYTEVARTLGRNVTVVLQRWPGRGWTKAQAAAHVHDIRRFNCL